MISILIIWLVGIPFFWGRTCKQLGVDGLGPDHCDSPLPIMSCLFWPSRPFFGIFNLICGLGEKSAKTKQS